MSLAGAGRSPQNYCRKAFGAAESELRKANQRFALYCRKAIPTAGRKPSPQKQAVRLAPHRRQAVICLCTVFVFMRIFPRSLHICHRVRCFFRFPGILLCRKRRGEKTNLRTNLIFLHKAASFLRICAGQGRENGSNAAQERRKSIRT